MRGLGLRLLCSLSLSMAVAGLAGCTTSAANMAAKQPERVELDVLRKDTPKSLVVARLGSPASSTVLGVAPNNRTVEIYNFVQGYSALGRTTRVFTHSTLSVVTLGLWEVTGQAIEGYARGTRVSLEITYDDRDRLLAYCVLEGRDAIEGDSDLDSEAPMCASRASHAPAPGLPRASATRASCSASISPTSSSPTCVKSS